MNYNKLKSLVANVDAVETAMKIHLHKAGKPQQKKKKFYSCTPVSGA